MKNIKELKTYESPSLTVTEIETEDIIAVSGFDALITSDNLLGQGSINWASIEADL